MKKLISTILSMSIILSACNLNVYAEITPYECRKISGCNVYDGGDFDPNYDVTLFSVSQKDQLFDAADRRATKDIPKLENASIMLFSFNVLLVMTASGFLGVGVKNLCQRLIKKFKVSRQSKNFEELLSNAPDSEEKTKILDTLSGLKKLTKAKDKEQFAAELEKLKDLSGRDSEKLNIVKELESLKEKNKNKDFQFLDNFCAFIFSTPILLFTLMFTDVQLEKNGYQSVLMSLPSKLDDKALSYNFLRKKHLNTMWKYTQKQIDNEKLKNSDLTDDDLFVPLYKFNNRFHLDNPRPAYKK